MYHKNVSKSIFTSPAIAYALVCYYINLSARKKEILVNCEWIKNLKKDNLYSEDINNLKKQFEYKIEDVEKYFITSIFYENEALSGLVNE